MKIYKKLLKEIGGGLDDFGIFLLSDVCAEESELNELPQNARSDCLGIPLFQHGRLQIGVDNHRAVFHQAAVDEVVQRGDRKGGRHLRAEVVDDEQVGIFVLFQRGGRLLKCCTAEFDRVIVVKNGDSGVIGDRKSTF